MLLMSTRLLIHSNHPCPKMNAYLLTFFLCVLSLSAKAQTAQTELPRIKIQAGIYQIDAQVAATQEQRAMGLMYRADMPQHEGMVFVFEQAQIQCFWMKNTVMPLTAAFIADDGTIVNLADMKPLSQDSHCSEKPVRFVLEMKQGWFASKRIKKSYVLKSSLFKTNQIKSDLPP